MQRPFEFPGPNNRRQLHRFGPLGPRIDDSYIDSPWWPEWMGRWPRGHSECAVELAREAIGQSILATKLMLNARSESRSDATPAVSSHSETTPAVSSHSDTTPAVSHTVIQQLIC